MSRAHLIPALLLVGGCAGANAYDPLSLRQPAAERLVAIGDVHGDLQATKSALRLAGAIDETNRWIGGDLVVVQTGDQLDRGDDEQAILELLDRLQVEARAAGGALFILNGNHEIMNVELDLRYVTDGGFRDFDDAVEVPSPDSTLWAVEPEHRSRVVAFRPGGPYAQMMSDRHVALIVGRSLFVHGGIRLEHLDYGLDRLNAETRAWLKGESNIPEWVERKGSPIWTRHYSDEPDEAACDELEAVLARLDVDRIVVGHTVQEAGITSRCGDRAWCIDVGMAAHYGGPIEVLEITADGARPLRGERMTEPALATPSSP